MNKLSFGELWADAWIALMLSLFVLRHKPDS